MTASHTVTILSSFFLEKPKQNKTKRQHSPLGLEEGGYTFKGLPHLKSQGAFYS